MEKGKYVFGKTWGLWGTGNESSTFVGMKFISVQWFLAIS